MSDATSIVSPIDEDARRRFERASRQGTPLRIEEVLPPSGDPRFLGTLEELVHVEMEFVWKAVRLSADKAAAAPRVETYLARFPVLRERGILLRLLQTEYAARRRYGDRPAADEYRDRFPDLIVTGEELRPVEEGFASLSQGALDRATKPLATDLTPPTVEGYEITGRLGEGGMGVVWSALQLGTRRAVALKLLTAADAGSANARARFAREVELAARLEHPHIARVFDSGVHEGVYFYAMELVDGLALDAFIDRRQLSRRQIVELLEIVAAAVQHAHQKGVIHRDLKPSNILVTSDGDPRVLDFGLAKALLAEPVPSDPTVTLDGEVAGTPAYMSPEQAAGRADEVDTRTDVYSLGVILYRALTGRPPHDLSGTHLQVLRRITDLEPPRPRQLDATVDADLEAIVLKAMAKEPDERYPSAAELAADLQRYLDGRPVSARPATAMYLLNRWLRRHHLPATAAAVTLAVFVSMAVYSYVRIGKERDDAQTNFNEADKQRRAAVSAGVQAENARQAAVASEREALRRLAEGRLAEGNAKAAAGQWREAKEAFTLSHDVYGRLGVPPFPAEVAMTHALWHAPPPVQVIGKSHPVPFFRVAVSADGKRAVTGGYTTATPEPIRVWDLTTGLQVGKVSAPKWVDGLGLTPDGRYVLSAGTTNFVLVIEVETDKVVRALRGHEGSVLHVAVSSDGSQVLTASTDRTAKLWDLATGACRLTLSGHTQQLSSAALCPARNWALTGSSDKTVKLWDLSTGACLQTFPAGGEVSAVAISADGARAAAALSGAGAPSGGRTIRVWETDNGREVVDLAGHPTGASGVAFLSDGQQLLTAGFDDAVRLWDLSSGRELHCFTGHDGPSRSLALLPQSAGRLALSASDDGTLRVWDVRAGEREVVTVRQEMAAATKAAVGGMTHLVAVSPDGRLLISGGWATPARLFDAATGLPLSPELTPTLRAASFAPDGRLFLLAPLFGSGIEVWDVATLSRRKTLGGGGAVGVGGSNTVGAIAFSPDGRKVLSGGEDGAVRVWDVESGAEVHLYSHNYERDAARPAAAVTCVAFSKDGRLVASAGKGGGAKVWDLSARHTVCTIENTSVLRSVAFSPDARFVLSAGGARNNGLTLWNAKTGSAVRTFRGHLWSVTGAAFSPDGALAWSIGEDTSARLWEVATEREVQSLAAHTSWVSSFSLSGDGNILVTAAWDGAARVWDFTRPAQYRDLDTRVAAARQTLEKSPGDAASLAVLGEWYAFRGLDEQAIDFLERARAGGATNTSSLMLGRCYWRARRTEQAWAEFAKAVERGEAPADYLNLCVRAVSEAPLAANGSGDGR